MLEEILPFRNWPGTPSLTLRVGIIIAAIIGDERQSWYVKRWTDRCSREYEMIHCDLEKFD
jgi:hypothetical protein